LKSISIYISILDINFLHLSKALHKIKKYKLQGIHYDIMDHHFVPNLSFGTSILKNITDSHSFFIDAHLMVKLEKSQLLIL
jgi:ribulose-phosphate 3-epimerase